MYVYTHIPQFIPWVTVFLSSGLSSGKVVVVCTANIAHFRSCAREVPGYVIVVYTGNCRGEAWVVAQMSRWWLYITY